MNYSQTRIETTDYDAVVELERALGLDSEANQLMRGRGDFQVDVLSVGTVTLWRQQSSQRLMHEFAIPVDFVEICFARHISPLMWCGLESAKVSAVIHCGGLDYRAVTAPETVWYGILLPRSAALQWEILTPELLSASRERAAVLNAGPSMNHIFPKVDAMLDGQLAPGPEAVWSTSEMLLSICGELVTACFSEMKANEKTDKQRLIENALDFIVSSRNELLTAARIAKELGVSRRVLERGFQRSLGVTPYQFVLLRKLHSARRILRGGGYSVLEASCHAGFENPGRFAAMYARHFDELPSITKQNANTNTSW